MMEQLWCLPFERIYLRNVRHDLRNQKDVPVVNGADVNEDQVGVGPHGRIGGVRVRLSALHLVQNLLLKGLPKIELFWIEGLYNLRIPASPVLAVSHLAAWGRQGRSRKEGNGGGGDGEQLGGKWEKHMGRSTVGAPFPSFAEQ